MPWLCIHKLNEGGFAINEKVCFNRNAYTETAMRTISAPIKINTALNFIEDIIPAFYHARIIDFNNSKEGDARRERAPRDVSEMHRPQALDTLLHAAGYAPPTIARKLASMRSFYAFCQREGWVRANPAKPLRSPRRSRKLPKFLTGDEIALLPGVRPTLEVDLG